VDSTGFRTAVVQFLLGKLSGDSTRAGRARVYLRGEPCSVAELKEIGVHEKLDKSAGFRFLRSLTQLVQRSGLAAGTTLLFDEARRTLSLMSSRAKNVACENLLTVINRCNSGEFPGTLFLYAVMPEFFTHFATTYAALQQRCGPGTRINLETLKGINELDLLTMIGGRITEVFRIAYDDAPADGDAISASLRCMAEQSLRQKMSGSGARRLMVTTWVRALQQFRETGVRALSAEDADRLIEGAEQQLQAAEVDSVASEGE
jgi:hypothetical protein